jgi:hypothetical protein
MKDCSATSHCTDSCCGCHRSIPDDFLDPYCSHCLRGMYNQIRVEGGQLPLTGVWIDPVNTEGEFA